MLFKQSEQNERKFFCHVNRIYRKECTIFRTASDAVVLFFRLEFFRRGRFLSKLLLSDSSLCSMSIISWGELNNLYFEMLSGSVP